MHEFTWDEFQRTREYFEKKSLELMDHENKGHVVAGVPLQNYRQFEFNGRIFYSIQVNTYKAIIEEFLMRAQHSMPQNFGTSEAHDVIEAIRIVNPILPHEEFAEFLRNEQFAHVIETENGNVVDKILRLDLFRHLRADKNGRFEFTGGLMHAFKHFSRQGINYSTGKSNHELSYPQLLVGEIIKAFFLVSGNFDKPNEYVVLKDYDEDYNLKFVFYREENTQVFFLKTVYKEAKAKPLG